MRASKSIFNSHIHGYLINVGYVLTVLGGHLLLVGYGINVLGGVFEASITIGVGIEAHKCKLK